MPDIPDFIRKRMDDRLDYGTEEFVARRVLAAAGIVGKKAVSEALKETRVDFEEDYTTFDLATNLLAKALSPEKVEFTTARAKTTKEVREEFRTHHLKEDGLIMLARIQDRAVLFARVDVIWLLNVFRPPYYVSFREDDWVYVEQDLESFSKAIGVERAYQDLLQG